MSAMDANGEPQERSRTRSIARSRSELRRLVEETAEQREGARDTARALLARVQRVRA